MRSVLLLQRVIRGWSGREKFAWAKHNRAREIKEQRRLVLLAKESERRQRQQALEQEQRLLWAVVKVQFGVRRLWRRRLDATYAGHTPRQCRRSARNLRLVRRGDDVRPVDGERLGDLRADRGARDGHLQLRRLRLRRLPGSLRRG